MVTTKHRTPALRSLVGFFATALCAPVALGTFVLVGPLQSSTAWAAAKETKAAAKTAWVDMQAAILQTEEGKAAKARIEKEAEGKRNTLLSQQQELKKLDDEFQEKQAVLSEADKVAKTRDFQSKLQKLREAQMGFEQEVRGKEMKETQKIFQNLAEIVEEIAKKKGYEMIFERNAGALLYAARIDDITAEAVQMYNQKYKVKK